MEFLIVGIFILGYLGITLEHTTEIDKLAPALLMMALSWACIAFGIDDFQNWFDPSHNQLMDGSNGTLNFASLGSEEKHHLMSETLLHHFGKTCEILIFLIGFLMIYSWVQTPLY